MIVLVSLRFLVNFLIDVLILGDTSSARSIGNLVRRVFPWFHPRTQPEELTDTQQHEGIGMDVGGSGAEMNAIIIESILPRKVRCCPS